MSRLILVRHAQASFFSKNYDQLSPLGELQARALGEYWSRLGIGFEEVLVGPRIRQARTEEIIRSVYGANGKPWPQAEVRPGFDEHSVDQLLGEPLEELLRLHPALRPLAADYRNAVAPERDPTRLSASIRSRLPPVVRRGAGHGVDRVVELLSRSS